MEDFKHLLTLGDADFKMILEGLDALKSKDFGYDVMGLMLEGLIKPKEGDIEGLKRWEIHKKEEELKKIEKEIKRSKVKEEIDLLKAKITIVLDIKRRQETKSPERQLQD
jgi:hypothetical protein